MKSTMGQRYEHIQRDPSKKGRNISKEIPTKLEHDQESKTRLDKNEINYIYKKKPKKVSW